MKFLSVDPGSQKCGVVLWDNDWPLNWWLFRCKARAVFEQRMAYLGMQIEKLAKQNHAQLIVCEKPFTNPEVPAHELNMIFKRVKRVARELRLQWAEIHPSTVKAAVKPRAFTGKMDAENAKAAVQLGVQWLYGDWVKGLDDNVIDAIAVGHAWLGMNREAVLVARDK